MGCMANNVLRKSPIDRSQYFNLQRQPACASRSGRRQNTRQTAENERHARLTAPRPHTRLTFKLRHCVRSDRSRAGADRTHGLHCNQRNACQFCRAVFQIAAPVGKQDFFRLPEQAGGLLALPRISKNRHSVARPCRTPCTVCGGGLNVYDGCPEARVPWAFQRGHCWNPHQLGISDGAALEPPSIGHLRKGIAGTLIPRGVRARPIATGVCLHCALSAAASAHGALNVCRARTSAANPHPQ